MNDEPLFVSVADAARLLGVGKTHIYALMARGEIPYRKLGTRRIIPRQWIEDFAADAVTPPPTVLPIRTRKTG